MEITLQQQIDQIDKENIEMLLDALKCLKDYRKITPKEYEKCLKRIHRIKLKDNAIDLRQSNKKFGPRELHVKPGIYTESLFLRNDVVLSAL